MFKEADVKKQGYFKKMSEEHVVFMNGLIGILEKDHRETATLISFLQNADNFSDKITFMSFYRPFHEEWLKIKDKKPAMGGT
jgi:hypothetical protein